MPVTYFHRYRMQYDLRDGLFEPHPIPQGYSFVPWQDDLLEDHAEVKYQSFKNELDASVFPCLGDRDGCQRLMREISCRQGFLPKSTWLVQFDPTALESSGEIPDGASLPEPAPPAKRAKSKKSPKLHRRIENCGTVQGIRFQTDVGTIQNIGIAPVHRGNGLGSLLIYHCLQGFAEAGVRFVTLEVTSHNTGAFQLYRRLGFRVLKTVFKSVEINY